MNNFVVKHEVTADFLVEAIQDFLNFRKENNPEWVSEKAKSLSEKLLDFVEACGVGNASSPSIIVDSFLLDSEIVCRAEEHAELTDEEWEEWASDNTLFHNDDYACLRF